VINHEVLAQKLGLEVITVNARTGEACQQLLAALSEEKDNTVQPLMLYYGKILEKGIVALTSKLPDFNPNLSRWLAIQFFEGNQAAFRVLTSYLTEEQVQSLYEQTEKELTQSQKAKTIEQHLWNMASWGSTYHRIFS